MDSRTAVDVLLDVDPGFVELCKSLLGDAVDPVDVWEFMYSTDPVVKMSPDSADMAVRRGLGAARGVLRKVTGSRKAKTGALMLVSGATGATASDAIRSKGGDSSRQYGYSITREDPAMSGGVGKADDDDDTFAVTWSGEFSKTDDEKRQVFGWASVVEIDGQPVVDRQGDWITPDEIEKAAYQYVVKSRKGGHQHKRDGDNPFHASDMIESIVFTPEKISKMGLPDDFPVGWWVGYKVNDDDTWDKVKNRDVTGFSIHGKGKRSPVGSDV
jgi:hypothetical protein